MQLVKTELVTKIIATEGKQIRSKEDIYIAATEDERGNIIPEHFPHYASTVYVPNTFTEEQMNELYIEEDIK